MKEERQKNKCTSIYVHFVVISCSFFIRTFTYRHNFECMQRKIYESYIYLGCLHYAIQNETSMLFFLVFSFSYYNFHTYGKYWGANKKLKQRLFKVTSPCRILLRSAFFFSMPRRQGVNFYIMWKRTRTDMNSTFYLDIWTNIGKKEKARHVKSTHMK